MQKKRRIYVGIIMLMSLFFLTGCVPGETKKEAGTKVDYYIGVVNDNAPYYYEENGTPKGYYVDLVAALAKEVSFTYEFIPVDISSYNENLSEKTIDGFIGDVAMDSEENAFVSEPLYTSNICILVPENSNISTLKRIKDNGIATMAGTNEESFATYLANRYKGWAIAFPSVKEAVSDIEAGNTQVLVADEAYYVQHKEEFKNWKILKISQRFQNTHRLFMQKDEKLQSIYSKGIKQLETDGGLKDIFTQN